MSVSRVLIDAANLHSGGGLQVAASFLDELATLVEEPGAASRFSWLGALEVEASTAVLENLSPASHEKLRIKRRDRRPSDLSLKTWTCAPSYDVCFSIFGPVYGRRQGQRTIVGFADGTSIYSVPEIRGERSARARVVSGVRRNVSRALFSRADRVVVEAPHVRDQLSRAWNVDPARVDVVPNCVNSVFTRARSHERRPQAGWLYVTRLHPHKNIRFLGEVGTELRRRGVHDVKFMLTLTDEEWAALDDATRMCSRNLGPQRVEQLPDLYASCEGVVFPSLLESFSAAPLEAIAADRPLVASDRNFVRDVTANAAIYADPRDAGAWADAIMRARTDAGTQGKLARAREEGRRTLQNPRDRAYSYLTIIDDEVRTLCQGK